CLGVGCGGGWEADKTVLGNIHRCPKGFPGGAVVKNPPANAIDTKVCTFSLHGKDLKLKDLPRVSCWDAYQSDWLASPHIPGWILAVVPRPRLQTVPDFMQTCQLEFSLHRRPESFLIPSRTWFPRNSESQCDTQPVTPRLTLQGLPTPSLVASPTALCRAHSFDPWSGSIPHARGQLGPGTTTAEVIALPPAPFPPWTGQSFPDASENVLGAGPCHLLFFLAPFPRHAMLICDKEWHYYVINVEFPVVTLYMDGATYEPYLVTNDWPIHPSHIAMQLTVGACWQGGEVTKPRFAQFFHGSLASLTIRPGKMDSQKVISCLQACKEGLDINSLESLGQGIKYHFNPSQSVLVMEGDDIGNINHALQKVSYINSRQFPTAGVRRLKVSSKVQCFGEDVCISIPDMDAYVMVLQAVEPQITLHGTDRFWRPAAQFESTRGVILFPDIKIVSTFAKAEAPSDLKTTAPKSAVLEEMLHNLDFCDILVLGGDLDPRQECLELNHSELHQRHLDATNSTAGYSIYGVGSMSRYEQVLRHIRYRNWRPAALECRRFRIKCSELNGRYTSNEFNLEVSVLHEVRVSDTEHVNHLIAQPPFLQSVHHPESQTSIQHSSVVPSIATVVIIISVCMLVFVVAMGVYRVRIAHQHFIQETEAAKEAEMDWDDSALTITVNPMEKHGAPGRGEEETEEEEEEEEVEEDLSSSSSESEGSDEEEEEGSGRGRHGQSGAKKAQLEWDDSTLPY
ncbi:hypothetical protein FD755_014270, partial [Muntiacus reevesi]